MEKSDLIILAELILALLFIWNERHIYQTGIQKILEKQPGRNSLITVGTAGAFLCCFLAVFLFPDQKQMAYLAGTYLLALLVSVMAGNWMKSRQERRIGEQIHTFQGEVPQTAIVTIRGREQEMPLDEIPKGALVLVKPGSFIPLDGTIVNGQGSVDESHLTGLSIPTEKERGDRVLGGSLNLNGLLTVQVTKTAAETLIFKLKRLAEKMKKQKRQRTKTTDFSLGTVFWVILLLAAAVAAAWGLLKKDLLFGLLAGSGVLMIACPAIAGYVSAAAFSAGLSCGLEREIFIRSTGILKLMQKADVIVFGKTGTLTEGKPRVLSLVSDDFSEEGLLALAGCCEQFSEHPLGEAVVQEAIERKVNLEEAERIRILDGMGAEAFHKGRYIYVGNSRMLKTIHVSKGRYRDRARALERKGQTLLYVVVNKRLCGIIGIGDTIKITSKEVIGKIRKLGLQAYMLTGDGRETADVIGRQVGMDKVFAEALPEEKTKIIADLQEQGFCVMMVGEGVNDAPAMAQADIGVAIGTGSTLTMDAGDVVLARSDLQDISRMLRLGRGTAAVHTQNLTMTAVLHMLGMAAAAGIFYYPYGALLLPELILLLAAASLAGVVWNSFRLKRIRLEG